jgi:hypothetical protein
MKRGKRAQIEILKAGVILFVILVINLQSSAVKAQGLRNFASEYQLGFEGAFGVKNFSITSNISQINNLNVTEEGGSLGLVMGAKALRIKLRQGYYYSSSNVAQTIDEVRSSFVANFYPIKLIANNTFKVQPYFMGGIERNIFKMYGTYGSESSAQINYSLSEAPFLGKISSMVASVGAGVEYRVESPGHFVTVFAEGRYGAPVNAVSSNALFQQTTVSDQFQINIGVAFGYHR